MKSNTTAYDAYLDSINRKDYPRPHLTLLSPSWGRYYSPISAIECFRDISSLFRAGGVKFKDGKPYRVEGWYVTATIEDGYIVVQTREFPEDLVRIHLARYVGDPTPLERLVAEYQAYKTKAFIVGYWHGDSDSARVHHGRSRAAIDKAYDFALAHNMPAYIIEAVNSMRG